MNAPASQSQAVHGPVAATGKEPHYKTLFMQAPVAIAVLEGPEHVYTFANPLYQKLVGRTEEQLIGCTVRQVFPEVRGQGIYELFHAAYQSGDPFAADEFPALFTEGGGPKTGYYNFVIQPIKDEAGLVTSLMVHAYEVTKQVLAHKKAEESEKRFSQMLAQSPYAFAILKGEDMAVYTANEAIKEVWGKGQDVEGKPLLSIMPEIADQGFPELLQSVYTTGKPFNGYEVPVRLQRKGVWDTVYFNFVYQPYREADGSISGVVIIANEVTPQVAAAKRAEQALKESKDLLQTVYDSAPNGIAVMQTVYDGEGKAEDFTILLFNDYTLNWIGGLDYKGKRYGDVFPRVKETGILDKFKEVAETGVAANFERWYAGEGMNHWFRFRAVKQEELLVVTTENITEQKKAETDLKKSESRFRLMADAIPEVVWVADAHGQTEFLNKRWEAFCGVPFEPSTAAEVAAEFIHPDDAPVVMAAFGAALQTGSPMEVEQRNRSASGEYRWFLNRAMPYRNPQTGEIEKWFGIGTDIHERKMAAQALQDSEQRFQNLIREASVGIVVLLGGEMRVSVVNAAYGRLINRTVEELLNKPLFDVIPDAERPFRHLVDKVRLNGEPLFLYNTPYLVYTNGQKIEGYLNVVYQPYRETDGSISGVMALCQDVTEQVAARQKLEEADEKLRIAVQSADLGIVEANLLTQEVIVSERMEEIFDVEPGTPWSAYVSALHPEDLPRRNRAFEKAYQDGLLEYEARVVRRNGAIRWIRAKGSVFFDEAKKPLRLVSVVQDMTQEKAFAEELQKQVQERTSALEQSNEELQQFAHVASHDLKEPVRKIRTFCSRMRLEFESVLPDKVKSYLDKIESASARMYAMIDGVLLYSSLNALQQPPEPVDLNKLMVQIGEDLEVLIQEKEAVVRLGHLPVVEGSPLLLHQLFYNLLNNSLKFTKAGTAPIVEVSAGTHEAAQPEANKEYVAIQIKDNGIGFDQAQAPAIFDTFTRLNSKDLYEGTGLGLALCKKNRRTARRFYQRRGPTEQRGPVYRSIARKTIVNYIFLWQKTARSF